MLNTLDSYIPHSIPAEGDFVTNPNLLKKVSSDGRFLPYRGNTAVFLLSDSDHKKLEELQDGLYSVASELLAERLCPNTFHLTLHDLANGTPGQPCLDDRMQSVACQAQQLLRRLQIPGILRLRATWLFNMVNTSIVLGFAPADGETAHLLDDLYLAFEEIVPLGYAMTPHITLAYFRPGCYPQALLRPLSAALRPVEWNLYLSLDHLVLQQFEDMDHYVTLQ